MNIKEYLKYDLPSSLVVFLVALPLCLGVALASGAPLFSGILAGIIGGIVAGSLSGSALSVSGPAAGLTTIVFLSISNLGSYPAFLLSAVLAGLIQIFLGFVRAGAIGNFFPASVVKGMLAAIGLTLILKQVPHAVGFDLDFEGDESFVQNDGQNTFSEIFRALDSLSGGAIIISLFSIFLMSVWQSKFQRTRILNALPSSLVVVLVAILLNYVFALWFPNLEIADKHLVSVPDISEAKSLSEFFVFPDFGLWRNPLIYVTAITIALVASLETLLSIDACDKLDPYRRITPLNRELKAQGIANTLSALLGGLPVTSVIVRSSANIAAGAKTKASTISHGIILLMSIALVPKILGAIPLACLAGLLIFIGYKLARPALFVEMYHKGMAQFLPFLATVIVVIFSDLLRGVFFGILVAIFFILKTNFRQSIIMVSNKESYLLKFTKDVSFLHKSTLRTMLQRIPPNAKMIIDGSGSQFIDQDIRETISDFIESCKTRNIEIELKSISLINKQN